MSSSRYIAWSVCPETVEPYVFGGEISIYTVSTGTYMGSVSCMSSGAGDTSGIADISSLGLRSGVSYKAVFEGIATTITSNQVYSVVSGASINFQYR